MIKNRYLIIFQASIALLATIAMYIGLRPLIAVPNTILQTDCIVLGMLTALLLILIKYIVRYSHFARLPMGRQIAGYLILGALFVASCIGISLFIVHELFSEDIWVQITPSIPIRIVFAILVYCLSIAIYKHHPDTIEDINGDMGTETDDVPENPIENIVEHIAVKTGQKIDVVPVSEIIHLQADGDYVMIYSTKGKYLKEQTMKSFESCLPSNKFVRVHRSNIVNIDYIAQIELYEKQTQLLKLKNGAQIKISQNGYKTLKRVIGL